MTKLEEAELITIEKKFVRKKPNTNVKLTDLGKKRIALHWEQLERLRAYASEVSASEISAAEVNTG